MCSEAGYLPAAVDYSYTAWPPAAPWAAAPYYGGYPFGPSLTTYPYAAPYHAAPYPAAAAPYYGGFPHGPTTAYHADPAPHGHDGLVFR